ncbi:borealin [Spea bombifrons]|uniref:borealin n=1 Tax=Spea bombifrons TaxID=233779 RepID=UPI002349D687|nr:borealin [Spea bombifrons]
MAPTKKRTNRGQKNRSVKNEKLASFIKDFDSQVKTIVEELKASVTSNLKEVDSLYNIELIKLPLAIREMCWLDFFAKGGSERALEAATTVNVDMDEITSSVSQTPFKSSKKAKKHKMESIQDDLENTALKSVLRTKSKAKVSAKKPATARKTRASAANVANTSKRASKRSRATPSTNRMADSSILGVTPKVTPKFDTRVFKTPGLRPENAQEPVYSLSANGSPLASLNKVFLNVPTLEGKNIRLMADDVNNVDLSRLDPQAYENIKLLTSQLEKICKKLK